jgi:phosphatidylglycerophosphate synthase
MQKTSYYIVNGITLYRLVTAPILIFLAIYQQLQIFRVLLTVSFFTDAIDGYLARRYKVVSVMGAKLDSISDDFTVLAGIVGLVAFRRTFIQEEIIPIILLLGLFLLQLSLALFKFGKMTSFHTYGAKIAAVLQGCYLILQFFFTEPLYVLFYAALIVTALELIEEIMLVLILRRWRTDVKGVYWVLKSRKAKTAT